MNLFLVGWSAERPVAAADARRALGELVGRLPFFTAEPLRSWQAPSERAAAAWVQHDPGRAGEVSYAAAEPGRVALFAGRPIRWTGQRTADGRSALDPTEYLAPAASWAEQLDGRAAVVRYDDSDRVLEVFTDALGAYPVFRTEADGVTWVSNNAELLRALSGSRDVDPAVLATLLGGGWSLSGHPLWSAVRRLDRGRVHRFGAADSPDLLPLDRIAAMCGRGLDTDAAADTLVAATRALADWPGRPSVVPLTGGRDSRVVLAAALRAGIEYETNTGGVAGDPDVEIGRALAAAAGAGHALIADDPHGSLLSHWRRAAELIALTAPGTASLSDALGFPFGPRDGPLPLWHSGQGGEIARGYYARAGGRTREALTGSLHAVFTGRRPGREVPLGGDGDALVRDQVGAWVDSVLGAGADPADVPDLFYLLERMGTWAGPTHGCVEYVRDTTAPLWSARLLPHELGLPARERAREEFHRRVLERLAPDLVDIPFEDGRPWPGRQSELLRRAARARQLAGKVRGELRRRVRARRAAAATEGRAPAPADPFAPVLADVRAVVLDQPSHPAWELLDRGKVESLLGRDAAALDTMSRYYVWRLATVFGASR